MYVTGEETGPMWSILPNGSADCTESDGTDQESELVVHPWMDIIENRIGKKSLVSIYPTSQDRLDRVDKVFPLL